VPELASEFVALSFGSGGGAGGGGGSCRGAPTTVNCCLFWNRHQVRCSNCSGLNPSCIQAPCCYFQQGAMPSAMREGGGMPEARASGREMSIDLSLQCTATGHICRRVNVVSGISFQVLRT